MDVNAPTLLTEAALNIALGGYSDQGHWLENNWNNIQLHPENNRVIVGFSVSTLLDQIKSQPVKG